MNKIITLNTVKVTDSMLLYALDGSTLYVMLEYLNPLGTSGQLLAVTDTNYADLLATTDYAEVNRSGGKYIINPYRVKKILSGVITFDNDMTVTSTDTDSTILSAINDALVPSSSGLTQQQVEGLI